jgi:hypothetical protein
MPFTQRAHGLRRDDLHVLDVFCPNFPQVVETQVVISFVRVDPKIVCLCPGTCGACCCSSSTEDSLMSLVYRRVPTQCWLVRANPVTGAPTARFITPKWA